MFNQFIGVGNLAADPELRITGNDTQVANFTVCCNSGYGDKKRTEFVRCIAWTKLAEIAVKYLHKGSKTMVVGEMQTRKWTDKNGNEKYTTEIIVRDLKMMDGKERDGGSDIPAPPMTDDSVPF